MISNRIADGKDLKERFALSRLLKNPGSRGSTARHERTTMRHARRRSTDRSPVQLSFAGGSGAGGPSVAPDSHHDGRGAGAELSTAFDDLYSDTGRPSIPPEQLLRALLLQVLYTIRSERLLMEQLEYQPAVCGEVAADRRAGPRAVGQQTDGGGSGEGGAADARTV